MKDILKTRIIVLLALAVFFGTQGFVLRPDLEEISKPAEQALQASREYTGSLAVKAAPAGAFGFLQESFQVQKTEDISVLQQDAGYAVNAPKVNNPYQPGGANGVFLGVARAKQSALENLRVSPLQIAERNLFRLVLGGFFGRISPLSGIPSEEKGLLQVAPLVFRPKTSLFPIVALKTAGARGRLRNFLSDNISFEEEGFVFRC